MNVFEAARQVNARDAAEHYGIKVKRNGMAICPFHKDHDPSMKLDKRFHCFGCGADGDAIDFTAQYFGLNKLDAAQKLAEDFRLEYEEYHSRKKSKGPPELAEEQKQEMRMKEIEKKLDLWTKHAQEVLIRYRRWLVFWEDFYRPGSPQEEMHPLFCEALQQLTIIDYYLDALESKDDSERLDFFVKDRKEVSRIEERVREYESGVLAELRRELEE